MPAIDSILKFQELVLNLLKNGEMFIYFAVNMHNRKLSEQRDTRKSLHAAAVLFERSHS
jgi:hypothetical protein